MSSLVTIRRCATLPEALICQGLMQANGIHSSVDNYYHASNIWWHVPALNGISLSVARSDFDHAHALLIEQAETGAGNLEEAFGAYEPPRRYGVLAAWYMLLDYTLHIPSLIVAFILAGLITLLDRITPAGWWVQQPVRVDTAWIPQVRTGTYNPIYNTSFEPEGVLFVIVIILVFVADRLIKPTPETKEDTP